MSCPLYNTRRWREKRRLHLMREPLCRFCRREGKLTPATVADHIEPHLGDPERFWSGAIQSLCATCHSSVKQAEEWHVTRGIVQHGTDASGLPTDPDDPWARY